MFGYLVLIAIVSVIFVALVTDVAFAVNSTAINEAQSMLESELDTGHSFHVFWIIFLLIILAVFMGTMVWSSLE